ncbi:MAG TPA: family 78 glycoside hydrolase catalytic domain [Polyangiaceae bacterium]|nr:family 78 glycoside hydrolase catalytic domain [Polyangiaceae bacterium]
MNAVRRSRPNRWLSRATHAALCCWQLLSSASAVAEPTAASSPASTEVASPGESARATAPDDLRVGDRQRPLNVEGPPLFSWSPHDPAGNQVQSAYQLQVWQDGSSHQVWDSGKIASSAQSYVPYAGVEGSLRPGGAYAFRVRTWNREGAASEWSAPAAFELGLERSASAWQASWIRRETDDAADAADEYTLARVERAIGTSPIRRARAYVAGSHQFELRVNGRVIDRGPAFAYPGEGYYQASDITGAVTPGSALALGVLYHWYGPGQGRPAGEPGVLVRVVVEHEDGSREVIVSDASWRVDRARAWQTGAPQRNSDSGDYVEWIDLRRTQPGWDRPGYDASGWTPPRLGTFVPVRAQEPRLAFSERAPVSVQSLADGSLLVDFGQVMPARPRVRFARGVAGRSLRLRAGYRIDASGHVAADAASTQGTDLSFRLTERDGPQEFLPFTHFAWRYLELSAPGEALGPEAFSAVVEHTDAPLDRRAEFESSDATLNAVFALAQRSALYSVQQQFVDTPTREKGQFLADAANISFATMAAWGERDATQKALDEFIQSQTRYWPDGRVNAVYPNGDGQRDIPDFTALFPIWVSRYYLETGDRELLGRAYPVLEKICGYLVRYRDATTGLITRLPGGRGPYEFGIVDWPARGRYGYDMQQAARSSVNMLAVAALRATAEAGKVLGSARAPGYAESAERLAAAINARLRRGALYVDGTTDGVQSTHASQHASSYALAFGIVPPAQRAAVAQHVASLGMQQGPMTAHWLAKALADSERYPELLRLLTDPAQPGWARLLQQGGTFTWESWEANASGDTESESHGWGSQIIVDVLETLLGVRVLQPGAAVVGIRPPRTGLGFARGVLHTERGPVRVDWSRQGSAGLELRVDVPMNVRAEVALPASDPARISATGAGAPRLREAGAWVIYEVGSGQSHFTLR